MKVRKQMRRLKKIRDDTSRPPKERQEAASDLWWLWGRTIKREPKKAKGLSRAKETVVE